MDVYVNDLSFYCNNDIRTEINKIKIFNNLLNELASKFNVSILAPKNIWSIPICGFNVTTKTNSNDTYISNEYHRFLLEIYRKFIPRTEGVPIFSLDKEMKKSSSSIGKAVEDEKLVVSLTFEAQFKDDTILGWLQSNDSQLREVGVDNLYDKDKTKNFVYLADLSKCRKNNPLDTPMWNIDLSKRILQGIDFIKISQDQRKSLLILYGKKIAEINGWTYNDRLSKLNTTKEHQRFIFDSGTNFTNYPKVYLSIDLEGPEVCYELCGKKGQHIGERSWDGKEKPEKDNHGIRLK